MSRLRRVAAAMRLPKAIASFPNVVCESSTFGSVESTGNATTCLRAWNCRMLLIVFSPGAAEKPAALLTNPRTPNSDRDRGWGG